MIHVENGELSVQGNASTLFAELTGAFKGITEGMLDDDFPKEMVERNVKGFMFLVQDICGELGIDTIFPMRIVRTLRKPRTLRQKILQKN